MRDKREKNWFWLENEIVDRLDLEPMERLLYMVLARHSDEDTSESFPSEDTLCLKTGIKDKRTIRKYINNLETKELLTVKREKGKSNRYYLNNVKVVAKNDTSLNDTGHTEEVTKNDTATNDTSDIDCKKAVTFDAQTSSIECHSNKTHIKIMKHEEHDIFENLFKELKINFTATNQKSVAKLLKTMSMDEVKNYLEETYKNLKKNSDIKNLPGAFSKKIALGKRQENSSNSKNEVEILDTTGSNGTVLTIDLIAEEKTIKEKLDNIFLNLRTDQQKELMDKAYSIARLENDFEPFVKLKANNKIKYDLLSEMYPNYI